MGVHGLWRLIEPSGKPVPLETLENKVLAVDISIWLHQAVKGFQDSKGASVPNAHLLGIYHRVCKLLYFKIKPVFVFDGGVPALKKQTIAKRTQSKLRNVSEADKIQKQLLNTLLKHSAVSKVLTEQIEASIGIPKASSRSKKDDIYKLPPNSEVDSTLSSSEDESYSESTTTDSSPTKNWDLHTIDMDSTHFKSLPVDVRHEILTDLKETRKQSSWGRLHELPKVSDDFSVYQMRRLLKRQAVQTALEDAEKEMGGKSLSLAELESILKDQGVITNQKLGNRIASDETTKYLLVKDIKKAIEEARKKELQSENVSVEEKDVIEIDTDNENVPVVEESESVKGKADIEFEEDLKKAIALSLECEPSTSEEGIVTDKPVSSSQKPAQRKLNPAEFSFLENFTDADFASSSGDEEENVTKLSKTKMSSAQGYMLEYSGLTPNEIAKIMNTNVASTESKNPNLKKSNLSTVSKNSEKIISPVDESSKTATEKTKVSLEHCDDNTHNKVKIIDDSVGIMSSGDSSDSEVDEKGNLEEINVFVNPSSKFSKEDDLFADVFGSGTLPSEDPSKEVQTKALKKSGEVSGLDIVINPTDKLDEGDDLFGDVFNQNEEHLAVKTKSRVGLLGSSNELLTNESVGMVTETNKEVHEDLVDKASISQETIPPDGNMLPKESREVDLGDNIGAEHIGLGDSKEETVPKKEDLLIMVDSVSSSSTKENVEKDIEIPKRGQKPAITEQELKELKNQLHRDRIDLLNEKSAKERMAGNITDQMYQEAQDLLELFGVPYVIAPMEAEAQCAFLDAIELTDGTITDDSDIWLFGGKTVYKNFFNQSKYVMEFRSENIQHHFKLTREQMILLALLMGSDYTIGLQGVGPVTAMEILAAFPPSKGKMQEFSLSHSDLLSGLREFRSWFTKGKSPGPGRSSLKTKLKNLSFTENFPSLQVVQAYLDPKVETSKDAFSWSKPNAMALLEFAREKFGWTRTKTEEILNPVLKKLEESKHQKSIRDYFKTRFKVHSGEAESKMSKRVKSAITNMGRDQSEILAEELQEELKKQPRKKPTQRKKKGSEAPEFSKAASSKKLSKADSEASEKNEFQNADKEKNTRKTRKVKLDKLRSSSEHESGSASSTSEIKLDEKQVPAKSEQAEENVDISEKIDVIRRRRKIKEAKAAIEIKKPKITEKKPPSQVLENIPVGSEADEEINLLSQIIAQSSEKVEEINKAMQEKIESMETKSIEVFTPAVAASIPSQSKPSPSCHRPVSRPTRIPRKETIPQQEREKTVMLRNKLKAIEVYRKGKQGPGFVPKRSRKKKLPKAEAELSESSDE